MPESFLKLVVFEEEGGFFDPFNFKNEVLRYLKFLVLCEEARSDLVLHFTEGAI